MLELVLALSLAGTAPAAASQPAVAKAAPSGEEAAIRAVDQAFVAAFNSRDTATLAALYADDAVLMDPGPDMWYRGKAEIAQAMAGLVGAPGKMTLALHDSTYHVAGDLGWATGLWTMKIETPDGKTREEHGRSSALFVRRAGRWLYLMDHASVPLPPPSGAPAAKPSN